MKTLWRPKLKLKTEHVVLSNKLQTVEMYYILIIRRLVCKSITRIIKNNKKFFNKFIEKILMKTV